MTLVGAQGADRVADMLSVQCGVPEVILYLSRALPSPAQLFTDGSGDLFATAFDSIGYLQRYDIKTIDPFS